jgi:hypothetical protein
VRALPGLVLVLGLAAFAVTAANAAEIVILNRDGVGEGFNDPAPAAPVGGNPATALGAQRLYVLEYAAGVWGRLLPDRVVVWVEVRFDPLACSPFSAVLGTGGATGLGRNFRHAPYPDTWYPAALANRLAMKDLDPDQADASLTFNSSMGSPGCQPEGWYLGVDGNTGALHDLLAVATHELGHGLGFTTSTDAVSGEEASGAPGIWDRFLLDTSTGRHWSEETDAERAASATSCDQLVWDGAAVTARAPFVLGATPLLRVTSPVPAEFEVGAAAFGPALTAAGVTGPVVLVQDEFGNPTNGCERITNDVAGKIALIDRGTCTFVSKVLQAQAAGAIAVILADSLPGCRATVLGGSDPAIAIPAVRITQEDGVALRALLPGGVTATLVADPARPAGADPAGRVKMYAPEAVVARSSVNHWDTSAQPDLLMEPFISTAPAGSVDLAEQLFVDIGWFAGTGVAPDPGLTALEPCDPSPLRGTGVLSYSLARAMPAELRVFDLVGRGLRTLAHGPHTAGRHSVTWDCTDAAGNRLPSGVYFCRLRTPDVRETRTLVLVR